MHCIIRGACNADVWEDGKVLEQVVGLAAGLGWNVFVEHNASSTHIITTIYILPTLRFLLISVPTRAALQLDSAVVVDCYAVHNISVDSDKRKPNVSK